MISLRSSQLWKTALLKPHVKSARCTDKFSAWIKPAVPPKPHVGLPPKAHYRCGTQRANSWVRPQNQHFPSIAAQVLVKRRFLRQCRQTQHLPHQKTRSTGQDCHSPAMRTGLLAPDRSALAPPAPRREKTRTITIHRDALEKFHLIHLHKHLLIPERQTANSCSKCDDISNPAIKCLFFGIKNITAGYVAQHRRDEKHQSDNNWQSYQITTQRHT